MSEYDLTPQEKLTLVEPNLKNLYREKYATEKSIACQQVVDDLRPPPKDENGKPLKREGKLVELGESDQMRNLVARLTEVMAQIEVLEIEALDLKQKIEAPPLPVNGKA